MVRGGVVAGIVVVGAVVALFGSMALAARDRTAMPTATAWYQAVDRACAPVAQDRAEARIAYRPDPDGDVAVEKRAFERYVTAVVQAERDVPGSAERVRMAAGVPAGDREEFLAAIRRATDSESGRRSSDS